MIIKKNIKFEKSFRNQSVIGQFDLQDENEIEEVFEFDLNLPENWKLGVIVGNSGTGKTTIAKDFFGFNVENKEHDDSKSVLDLFPAKTSLSEITKILTLVGFASPRSWLKPYHVLSNGEKMRVDLALELLSGKKEIIFDEFTSVVDRDVAKTMCLVINKILKFSDVKIILVSCHFDILNFLDTDWIFNTNEMSLDLHKKKDYIANSKFSDAIKVYGDCLKNITI